MDDENVFDYHALLENSDPLLEEQDSEEDSVVQDCSAWDSSYHSVLSEIQEESN